MTRIVRTLLAGALVFGLFAAVAPQQADAQGLFRNLFGGGNKSSYIVRFSDAYSPGTIIVSFGDRRLYFIQERGRAISYPIGVPTGRASWSGSTHVSYKRVNPGWTPTPDMRRENPSLPAYVPGGHPQNPLGPRAMYLGDTLYRIHGTDAPWTVGRDVSRGCVRMHNKHVVDLYGRTRVGAKVIVTQRRILR